MKRRIIETGKYACEDKILPYKIFIPLDSTLSRKHILKLLCINQIVSFKQKVI